jgi:hypothetical protein
VAEQIQAVFENLVMPRGQAVVVGDLVLTSQRAAFVELASWAPNYNANPVQTAVAGALGGFAGALIAGAANAQQQSPVMTSLISDAEKARGTLWGMSVDERICRTKSRTVIPIGEFHLGQSSDGVNVQGKRRGCVLYPAPAAHTGQAGEETAKGAAAPHVTEAPPEKPGGAGADLPKFAIEGLKNTLAAWAGQSMPSHPVEGYGCRFPAPLALLDKLAHDSIPEPAWSDAEMLDDPEYINRLAARFLEEKYRRQNRIIATLAQSSHRALKSFLEETLISSLITRFDEGIQKEMPALFGTVGVPVTMFLFAGIFVFGLSSGWGVLCMPLTLISLLFSGTWADSSLYLRRLRKRLREHNVDVDRLESRLRYKPPVSAPRETS